jgi:hypothetical protein
MDSGRAGMTSEEKANHLRTVLPFSYAVMLALSSILLKNDSGQAGMTPEDGFPRSGNDVKRKKRHAGNVQHLSLKMISEDPE